MLPPSGSAQGQQTAWARTEKLLRRAITFGLAGVVWVFVVAAAAAGNDSAFATIAGNILVLAATDPWHRWRRWGRVVAASLLGSVGGPLLWEATPWRTGSYPHSWVVVIPYGLASAGLWWAAYGHRFDRPPKPPAHVGGWGAFTPRAERWIAAGLVVVILAILYYVLFAP